MTWELAAAAQATGSNPGFLGVSWTEAAIVAAVVSGVFAVVGKAVRFGFRILEEERQIRREQVAIASRVLHDYFQMGVGAMKALESWDAFEAMGWPLPGTTPEVSFLLQLDKALPADVLKLTSQSPEVVSAYLHGVHIRKYARHVLDREKAQFKTIPYAYPNTRNTLLVILQHATESLRGLIDHLPGPPWWRDGEEDPKKPSLRQVARNLVANFEGAQVGRKAISKREVLGIALEARERLEKLSAAGPQAGGAD